MADVGSIRAALATFVSEVTGLRAFAEAKDQVSPPCIVILPGQPLITYGQTLDGAVGIGLRILLILSDAAPVEKVQRALDAYLGIGPGTTSSSIPAAIMDDPTLGGAVEWCEPLQVTSYNRIEYAGIQFFGARIDVTIGAH